MTDELSRRLAAYESDLVATFQLAPVEAVRARGERRRVRTYAAVAAAVMAVLLGGAAVAAAGGFAGGTQTGDANDGWISADELAGLKLPHEGDAGYTLWTSVSEPSAVQPCADWGDRPLPYAALADPTRTGRTAARTVTSRPGPGSLHPGQLTVLTSQVLLFASADLAAGAVRELADGVTACGWMASMATTDTAYTWLASQRSLAGGYPETKVVEAALVYRTGNAVAIVYSHEPERIDASLDVDAGAAMTELLSRLCSIAPCGPDAPLLFSEFPSVNPPQTYGPSDPPGEPSPYPTSPVQETPPPSETPPLGGASPS
jgi:hypothetical protein